MRHALVLAALCAACTPLLSVTSAPVDVNVTDEAAVSGAVGSEPTYIQTYTRVENKSKAEIKDVPCDAKGPGFDAQVVTPAILNLPDRGNLSRPVNIVCTKDGATSTGIAEPFNRTSANMLNTGVSGGLPGMLVIAGYDAARSKSDDDWGYQNVDIVFTQ